MPPEQNAKICGAVPIRAILILWAVLKLLAAIVSMLYILLCIYFLFIEYGVQCDYLFLGILVFLEVALLVDIAMSITLIVGESKKNYRIVTAYFRYAVYAVVVSIIIIMSYTIYELTIIWGAEDNAPWRQMRTFNVENVVQLAIIGTIYVLFEVFIVFLLRTEATSLRRQQQMACKSPSERQSFMQT